MKNIDNKIAKSIFESADQEQIRGLTFGAMVQNEEESDMTMYIVGAVITVFSSLVTGAGVYFFKNRSYAALEADTKQLNDVFVEAKKVANVLQGGDASSITNKAEMLKAVDAVDLKVFNVK